MRIPSQRRFSTKYIFDIKYYCPFLRSLIVSNLTSPVIYQILQINKLLGMIAHKLICWVYRTFFQFLLGITFIQRICKCYLYLIAQAIKTNKRTYKGNKAINYFNSIVSFLILTRLLPMSNFIVKKT